MNCLVTYKPYIYQAWKTFASLHKFWHTYSIQYVELIVFKITCSKHAVSMQSVINCSRYILVLVVSTVKKYVKWTLYGILG